MDGNPNPNPNPGPAPVHFIRSSETAPPLDHNPALKPWQSAAPNNVAGKGHIEAPGAGGNIVWQNRSAGPSDYENALGDAFELLFEAGADSPQQMVDGLNRLALRTPDGRAWTLASFEAELARLGA